MAIQTDSDGKRYVDLDPDKMKYSRREGSSNGKGSARRPSDKEAFDAGWDRIWGKKE